MNPISFSHPRPLPGRIGMIPRRTWTTSAAGFRRFHLLLVRSGGETAEPSSLGPDEAVDGLLGERVDELLKREENRPLLGRLEEASRRVDRARAALADIEKQQAEALRTKQLVLQLQSRESEIAVTQKELLKARGMVEESERHLSFESSELPRKKATSKEIERLESIKAASISSIVGTLASLPLSLYQATNFTVFSLHTTIIFIGTALFGVTFRYTIRRDIDNFQLKTGTSAAFGIIKGLAEIESGKPVELNLASFVSHCIDGAVSVSENIIIFVAAAIALDFCFKMRLLSPFPMEE
ncbi:uncharacterized protein LOC110096225 [Dendrobium catenatum]|uniref:Uncharacterized protein n=1 Tax=Dendrobium catenatum TaxID=906689 RepID=A0A2I0XCS4_9ASPA|nr:uncharacterized protein LOC110096225 [Dendrobium catenatum]PKU85710.1 hypothetical protein MA16_Dca003451 [Dendrobium catenatum]